MSVYKHPKTPYYQYDFVIRGHRFHGSTGTDVKREAVKFEAERREQARKDLAAIQQTGKGPLTIDDAADRYWIEVGQHHVNSETTAKDLERLVGYFGKTKRLDDIRDPDVAALVVWRRAQPVHGRTSDDPDRPVRHVANATVNRSTTQLLQFLFSRARTVWHHNFTAEPRWRDHKLKEPKERVRELDQPEGEALDAAVRDDYALWFEFARLTGLRRAETLIKWSQVNIFAKRIASTGKGGALISTPITPAVAAILKQCEGHHPVYVFTYICKRADRIGGLIKGNRYPITREGAKTQWRRLLARSKVDNFRFHDIRHDVGTKLLRATGNLKIVQRALNHADIKTTTKYAHVLDDEVAAALADVGNSRNNSRTDTKAKA